MALNPSIPPPISDQIKLRQKKLNLSNSLSDTDLVYRNNRYPFIRLTSGININDSVVSDLGLNGLVTSGNDLAKKYKLFSTRFQTEKGKDEKGNTIFAEDFASNVGYSFSTPTAYGFTSNPSFGYTPPPGIVDINIKTLNKGGIRTAEINLIAHNILQFNIINALYLKLRYCMLLEWGHNIYYDNSGNYVNNSIDLSKLFLVNSTSLLDVLTAIEQKQIESCGNYDALVGVVKNFTWDMTPEGSYQIKIELISAGDIAESIQINTALAFKADPEKSIGVFDTQWLNPITYNRSSLDRMLKRIQAETSWHGSLSGDDSLSAEKLAAKTGVGYSFKKTGGNLTDTNETYSISFSSLEYDYSNAPVGQYYIKLGALLRIIESFLLEYDTASSTSNPSIFLDYDYDNNFCFTLANQLSADPTVCLIPLGLDNPSKFEKKYFIEDYEVTFEWDDVNSKWKLFKRKKTGGIASDTTLGKDLNVDYYNNKQVTSQINFYISEGVLTSSPTYYFPTVHVEKVIDNPAKNALSDYGILKSLDNRFRTEDVFKGKLMHVLLNMNFIHKTIEDNIDSDGKLTLNTFLNSLLDGLQGSLGYINDFTLSYNHANNSLRILDNTYLTNLYDKINPSIININTVTPSEGSFVLDYSMKSDVFSKQGNALLAGSQTNGNTGVSNGTMFAELYKGTTDRVLTTKQNNNTPKGDGGASTELYTAFERYKQYRLKLTQLTANGTAYSLSKEDVNSFKDSIKDYYRFEMGQFTKKNNISGDRLIPLNLQLTVDGLSGLDIHQVFAVNNFALPSDYVGNVGFVIRELTHKINSGGWTTDIGSLSVLKRNTVPVNDIDIIEALGNNTSSFTQFEEEIVEAPVKDKTPPTGEATALAHIAIGDSQTPAIASKSTKVELVASTEGVSSLWKVGEGIKWLTDSVKAFGKSPDTKTVVVSIGTNGAYVANSTQANELMTALKTTFPNAKYIFVPGSWGWGNLNETKYPGSGFDSTVTPARVTTFYNQFSALGATILGTPIGYSVAHPSGATQSYVQIGKDLDLIIT